MSDLKFVILFNVLLKILYCVCVTVAAIHFNDARILWWYLLATVFGYDYSSGKEKEE
jgi:hypothetical protein